VTKIRPTGLLRRSPRVAYRELAGERGGVLLRLDTGAYHGVDAMGALVWRVLEGSPTFEELLPRVRGELEDVPTGFEVEIERFLADLRDRGLIEVADRGNASEGRSCP
jgi:hypothetical protein